MKKIYIAPELYTAIIAPHSMITASPFQNESTTSTEVDGVFNDEFGSRRRNNIWDDDE